MLKLAQLFCEILKYLKKMNFRKRFFQDILWLQNTPNLNIGEMIKSRCRLKN